MQSLQGRLRDIVGPSHCIVADDDMAAYLRDWNGVRAGPALAVVMPESVEEIQRIVRLCAGAGVAITPQGGNTGQVAGAIPTAGRPGIVLKMSRLDRIRSVDPGVNEIVVDAGVILANVQAAARAVDRLFPLRLAAEGTCQIGGNLATNAGGTNVLRYGSTRELVLGLEVVLADGGLWQGLDRPAKDNSGYDLRHLFLGSEGTLGVITGARLKLFPSPRAEATALLGVDGLDESVAILAALRRNAGDTLTMFELVPRIALEMVLRHLPDGRDPFERAYEQYLVVQLTGLRADEDLRERLGLHLEELAAESLVGDAAVAASVPQAHRMLAYRERIAEALLSEGAVLKYDVGLLVSRVAPFIRSATEAVLQEAPGARVVAFGHIADGNIHFEVCQPLGSTRDAFLARRDAITRRVHDEAVGQRGSIASEHGVGQLRRGELARLKDPVEIEAMRALKRALDPQDIMNPGKIL